MKSQPEYHYLSIAEVSELIRQKRVSPVELVAECLKRIEKLNAKLNAFITVLADPAIKRARGAEADLRAGKWRGPLHGIPVAVKDFYDTAGIKTTAAFERFKDRVPAKDAESVTKLKEAGAIIVGKTNMHQLGAGTTGLVSYCGPIHNPWDPAHIAGGSSGGSAAAVASGMCYATLDTDAIGSCRLPAACCGVVGFKGTYGLISTRGILEGEQPPDEAITWLSHAGITTRSVKDTAIVLDVLMVRSEQTKAIGVLGTFAEDRRLRIGVANKFKADQQVRAVFGAAVETIRDLGYPMSSTAAPFGDPSQGIGNIEGDRKAIAGQAFKDIDILLLPTTTVTTPAIKEVGDNPLALSPENTTFANYYGLPAISVPCGVDKKDLPVGLQIVGPPWAEQKVLDLAHAYQQSATWHLRHPID